MIEVKIGDVVHVVRTRVEWFDVEQKALEVLNEAAWRQAQAEAKARCERLEAEGWALRDGYRWRWDSGILRKLAERGTHPNEPGPPVELWTRESARHKWHRHPVGHYGSPCPGNVSLHNGREVSAVEPLADVCLHCARWGAP